MILFYFKSKIVHCCNLNDISNLVVIKIPFSSLRKEKDRTGLYLGLQIFRSFPYNNKIERNERRE